MDKKVEVFDFWWQVWEALDEESKEACRKELKEDYENALEDVKEDSRHYDGPDTSSLEVSGPYPTMSMICAAPRMMRTAK